MLHPISNHKIACERYVTQDRGADGTGDGGDMTPPDS